MTDEQYEAAQNIQTEITELTDFLEGGIIALTYQDGSKTSSLYPSEDLQEDITRVIQDRVEFLKKRFAEL